MAITHTQSDFTWTVKRILNKKCQIARGKQIWRYILAKIQGIRYATQPKKPHWESVLASPQTSFGIRLSRIHFTSFRLRYSLRTRPFATDSGFATWKVNYSTVNFIDLKLGTLKLECWMLKLDCYMELCH